MAHWIVLPDGSFINTDALSGIGPQMPLMSDNRGHYRSYSTQAGYNGRIEGASADRLAAAITTRIAEQGATAASAEAQGLARWMPGDPGDGIAPVARSIDVARHIHQGEERALDSLRAVLRGRLSWTPEEAYHLDVEVRAMLGGDRPPAAGADPLPDVAPLGSRDESPPIRQLDLRQGDDVLSLRYGGVDYVAAIKLRFGDGVEGFSDRYLEVSAFSPHQYMWVLVERVDAPGKTDTRFAYALGVAMKHDRAAFLGG